MRIVDDDLTHPEVVALLAQHLREMQATSPPESVHALDVAKLRAPGVAFFTAWDDAELMGCAAMRDLGDGIAEVKSMRTADAFRRRGVAVALLDHVIAVARARGYRRLSLETGSGPAFAAPIALYHGFGFAAGATYGDYGPDPFLTFMHLEL